MGIENQILLANYQLERIHDLSLAFILNKSLINSSHYAKAASLRLCTPDVLA